MAKRKIQSWVLSRAGKFRTEARKIGIKQDKSTQFLYRLYRTAAKNRGAYYQQFLRLLSIANDKENRELAKLAQAYIGALLNAQTDKQFGDYIIQHEAIMKMFLEPLPEPVTASDIEFVEPPSGDDSEPDPMILQRVATKIKNVLSTGHKVLKSQEFKDMMMEYVLPLTTYYAANKIPFCRELGFQRTDNLMVSEQSIACVVGVIPLRHIQEIEIARSGKILKFRATGSVFLANQEGGLDAIRVEGYLVRGEIVTLIALLALQYFSTGKRKEITPDMLENIYSLEDLRKALTASNINPLMEKPSYVYHNTFPFVSKHVIIPNAYIETISFEEKVVFGKDVIAYSILMRTYTKPTSFVLYDHSESSWFYGMMETKQTKTLRMIEFFVNAARRFVQSQNVIFNEQEWKIKYNQAGMDDVYYEIDGLDLAISVVLGVIGLKL